MTGIVKNEKIMENIFEARFSKSPLKSFIFVTLTLSNTKFVIMKKSLFSKNSLRSILIQSSQIKNYQDMPGLLFVMPPTEVKANQLTKTEEKISIIGRR